MPNKLAGCQVTQKDTKMDGYTEKTGQSGVNTPKVKIKTSTTRDCRVVRQTNEVEDPEEEQKEVLPEEEKDEEKSKDTGEIEEKEGSMAVLMENFRDYIKKNK